MKNPVRGAEQLLGRAYRVEQKNFNGLRIPIYCGVRKSITIFCSTLFYFHWFSIRTARQVKSGAA
jgi:hypothetical protein